MNTNCLTQIKSLSSPFYAETTQAYTKNPSKGKLYCTPTHKSFLPFYHYGSDVFLFITVITSTWTPPGLGRLVSPSWLFSLLYWLLPTFNHEHDSSTLKPTNENHDGKMFLPNLACFLLHIFLFHLLEKAPTFCTHPASPFHPPQ